MEESFVPGGEKALILIGRGAIDLQASRDCNGKKIPGIRVSQRMQWES